MHAKDYNKGKIYRIWCISGECDDVYIGSTIQSLSQRWSGHKTASKREKGQYYRLYQAIAGNWDAWKIELVEYYPCETLEELNRREGELIRETGTLNTHIAGRTRKEWYKDNRDTELEKQKTRYQKNTETILKKHKDYRIKHAETIAEKAKAYHKKNADTINERHKIYHKQNAKAIAERKKAYRQRHAEAIAEKGKVYSQRNADTVAEQKKKYR